MILSNVYYRLSQCDWSLPLEKTYMIVDDDQASRFTYIAMLESLGITSVSAESSAVALAECSEKMPDFIILDWMMPTIDGIEFINYVRKFNGGEKPYIILCSGKEPDNANVDISLKAGANAFLQKPVRIEQLKNEIEKSQKNR